MADQRRDDEARARDGHATVTPPSLPSGLTRGGEPPPLPPTLAEGATPASRGLVASSAPTDPESPPARAEPGMQPTFVPGAVVAGRYRITRFIAFGGVGEVYEAVGVELGERVALKTLRMLAASQEAARERFRREIQLARQVTHPNVCRIYDAGYHQQPGQPGLLYLTMELLAGETLHQRVRRDGPLAPRQALPLVRQMVAALDAAHRAGVIHRDFKSGNVILVAPPPGETEERVVVTDFGLARALHVEAESEFHTAMGSLIGTPAYMAPEQVEDAEVSAASDVYALGVVLFEMLTGQLPFAGHSPLATAVMRLKEPPPAPSGIVPGLDPVWEEVVLRCLERHPEARFARVREVIAALDGEPTTTLLQRPEQLARRRRRGFVVGGISAVAALALGALSWWVAAGRAPQRPGPPRLVQLTSAAGVEIDPAFAPNGNAIAYASDRSGSFELYLKQLAAGGGELQLTSDGGESFQPTFSPDGSLIAFAAKGRGGIWVVPALGGTARQLASFGSHPAWSPDGLTLAFQEDGRHEVAARSAPALPPSTLWLVPAASGEPRRLTTPGEPAGGHGEPVWSPDGRRLVFSAGDRRGSTIWSVAVVGAESGGGAGAPDREREDLDLAPLVTDRQLAFHPALSPDGRTLYFVGLAEEGMEGAEFAVWRVGLDGNATATRGEAERVSSLGVASVRHLAMAPDGSRLAYAVLATVSNLWAVGVDAAGKPVGEPAAITAGTGRNSRPAIAPDGRTVAFDRWSVGVNLDIWLLGLDGAGEPRQLTTDVARDSQASWTADGRSVVVTSEREGRLAAWRIEVEGGRATRLAELPVDADWVRLSPDGGRLAFHARSDGPTLNLFTLDLEPAPGAARTPRQLTFDAELASFPVWSPDGAELAFELQRGDDTHVAVIPAAGGEPRQLTAVAGDSWPYSYSPAGDRIAFAGRRADGWNVYWVSRNGGEEHQLTSLGAVRNGYVRYPSWSPTGDRIVYELSETTGDLWVLENP